MKTWPTRRAETIDGCAEAARLSGFAIIGHMPRMTEFYRKRANEQLRAARKSGDADLVADAKAKLDFIGWAENWMRGPIDTWPYQGVPDSHYQHMNSELSMIGYSLQKLIQAYARHADFREEWRP